MSGKETAAMQETSLEARNLSKQTRSLHYNRNHLNIYIYIIYIYIK